MGKEIPEGSREKELLFDPSNMLVRFSEFNDLLQIKGVKPFDLEETSDKLVECNTFGDVLELMKSGIDPLISLVIYYMMKDCDNKIIVKVITDYPNSLESLRNTLDSAETVSKETEKFGKYISDILNQQSNGETEKEIRMLTVDDEKPPQSDKRISSHFQEVNLKNESIRNKRFEKTTKMLVKGRKPKEQ